jgi:hypothetical protein
MAYGVAFCGPALVWMHGLHQRPRCTHARRGWERVARARGSRGGARLRARSRRAPSGRGAWGGVRTQAAVWGTGCRPTAGVRNAWRMAHGSEQSGGCMGQSRPRGTLRAWGGAGRGVWGGLECVLLGAWALLCMIMLCARLGVEWLQTRPRHSNCAPHSPPKPPPIFRIARQQCPRVASAREGGR